MPLNVLTHPQARAAPAGVHTLLQRSVCATCTHGLCSQTIPNSCSYLRCVLWKYTLAFRCCFKLHIHGLATGQVKWRLEYRHVASPVARLLLSDTDGTSGVFALFGKVGHSPRVYASRDRDALLKQVQAAAYKKMGLALAGIAWEHLLPASVLPCRTDWQSLHYHHRTIALDDRRLVKLAMLSECT